MEKFSEFIELKLEVQRQIYISKILKLQMEILKNEELPAHHRSVQYDILDEVIKLIKEDNA